MTQKELSYIEDAIGHEKNIIKICEETIKLLQDEKLKEFIQNEISEHTTLKEKLMNILGAKANEWSVING